MEPGNAQFDSASKLEKGGAADPIDSVLDEKTRIDSSPTLTTASTFKSGQTTISASSKFKRARTWSFGSNITLFPRTDEPEIEFNVTELESQPNGYPRLACYLASDEAFMTYRRFGIVHSRLLLQKQDELRELESELFTADNQDEKNDATKLYLKSREEDHERKVPPRGCRQRKAILEDIERKLLEYGNILKLAHELNALSKPYERDHRSVINFIKKYEPLEEREREFVYEKEDLVSLRCGREHAWLDAAVEASLRWFPCRTFQRLFSTKEDQRKTTDPLIHYFSRSRINFVVTLIITFIILILLVAPIVGLFELTQRHNVQTTDAVCIGILLVSTLVFSSVLSMFTKARRHEILAAAAGYCAVLVVFVGNIGSPNNFNAP